MRYKFFLILVCLPAVAYVQLGATELGAPSWWGTRGIITTDPNRPPDNYTVINQGQLKNIAHAAYLEFEDKLPNGAGLDIKAMIDSWDAGVANADDYAVANIGQVIAVARPFYTRLATFGVYRGQIPLSMTDSYSVANIGQVKFLFSFDPATDDSDGDGLSTLEEWRLGTNPFLADTDGDGFNDKVDLNPFDPTVGDSILPVSGDTTAPVITLISPAYATAP